MGSDSGRNDQTQKASQPDPAASRVSVYSDEKRRESRYRERGSRNQGASPRLEPPRSSHTTRSPDAEGSKRSSQKIKRRHFSRRRAIFRSLWLLVLLAATAVAWIYWHRIERERPRLLHPVLDNRPPILAPDAGPEEAQFAVQQWVTEAGQIRDRLRELEGPMDARRLEQVAERLRQMLAEDVRQYDLRWALAEVYRRQQRETAAAELLLQILQDVPSHQRARDSLLTLLLQEAQYPAVLTMAQWILGDDPFHVPAHRAAAEAYLATDRPDWAIAHLRKLTRLDAQHPEHRSRLAAALFEVGDHETVVALLAPLAASVKVPPEDYRRLALSYSALSQADQAVETLQLALQHYGESTVASWLEDATLARALRRHPGFQQLSDALQPEAGEP